MAFSNHILDTFVAPDCSKFQLASIPDLRGKFPEAPHWVANYLLNSAMRGKFKDGTQQAANGFLRRAEGAFAAYHEARGTTLEYIDLIQHGQQSIRKYYAAVDRWEMFALNMSMLFDLFVHVTEGVKVFHKLDRSPEDRLMRIANQVKHAGEYTLTPQEGIPLWLSNNGLEAVNNAVSFDEAAKILSGVAGFANRLQDPITAVSP